MEALSKESITQKRISLYVHRDAAQVFTVTAIVAVWLYINLYAVSDVDEMYKYIVSRAVAKGYSMYTEINMIETPLYFILTALPLRINDTFIMYRVFSAVLFGCCAYLIYLVLKDDAKYPKISAYIIISLIFSVCYVASYNLLTYMFLLAAAYIYKVNGITERSVFALGIDISLIILTKHTTGLAAFIFFTIFLIYKETEIKTYIKCFAIPVLFTCLLFIMELGIKGEVEAFTDQCIAGLGAFAVNNSLFDSVPIIVTSALALAAMAAIRKNTDDDMDILHAIAATAYTMGFPIADYAHMVISAAASIMILMMAYGRNIDAGHFEQKDDIFIKAMLVAIIVLTIWAPSLTKHIVLVPYLPDL